MRNVVCTEKYKINDIRFDFEIGEMTDLIMSKNLISSRTKVDAKDVLLNRRNKNV